MKAFHKYDEFVELTDEQYEEAVNAGINRNNHSTHLTPGTCYESGLPGDDTERIHCSGMVGERAVAVALDLEWTQWINTFRQPDLHYNIEVRSRGKDHYDLKVRVDDDPSRRIVLVIVEWARPRGPYRIPGWINAMHAKKEKWLCDPKNLGKPFYGVPQCALHPLDSLRKLIHKPQLEFPNLQA